MLNFFKILIEILSIPLFNLNMSPVLDFNRPTAPFQGPFIPCTRVPFRTDPRGDTLESRAFLGPSTQTTLNQLTKQQLA